MTPLDWTHAVRDVPSEGLVVERTATPEECNRLAETLDIVSVDRLVARYRLIARSGRRLALTGTIQARVTQECVITLDPLSGALSLPLDVIFVPRTDATDMASGPLEDLDAPDEEPIENGIVDVGRVIVEELLSGLDPYPRHPDAQFDWTDAQGEIADDKPFAALARLRKSHTPD
jgi:uncharacterized metal-binding protein YceD (DUF177 family)